MVKPRLVIGGGVVYTAVMLEKSRRRLVAAALVVLCGLVFGLGMNWGLPTHAIDPFLFGTGSDSPVHSLRAYKLSGVGIVRLAGSWEDNGNLPADAAAHQIDRSKPVTLLENAHELTETELRAEGDAQAAALSAKADAADKHLAEVRLTGDEKTISQAQTRALAAQQKIHQYVEAFNRSHFPNLGESAAKDDVSRARILRRYRLYSDQPDEMISLRALADMHPGKLKFDPKLYQYGGLWLYPLGAIFKAASLMGYVTVSSDSTVYLDSPESFGRFYILARGYSAAWGVVAVLATYGLIRRAGAGWPLAFAGALSFMCMPAVVDLAHEAKPHLAGTALTLLAVWAGSKYAETGRGKWIAWTSVACGAAAGMVLSAVASLAILPVMALARRESVSRVIAISAVGGLIAAAVYFAANPYVAIHLVGDHTLLAQNLANSRGMYPVAFDIVNAVKLLMVGASWPVAAAGVIGMVALIVSRDGGRNGITWLMGIPAVIVFVQFVLHAGGKPGEYARFAFPVDAALLVAAFVAICETVHSGAARVSIGVLLVVCAAVYSAAYERGFLDDSSRRLAAREIDARLATAGANPVLYVTSEPAPYCLPPVNLFRWRMVLLASGGQLAPDAPAGLLVKPGGEVEVFNPAEAPMSWANPAFVVAEVGGK